MRIQAKTITIETAQKLQIFDITQEVKGFLAESGVWNGMGVLSTLHTTTAVFFTETQDALWEDVEIFLQNFLTGVVAASLFWTEDAGAIPHFDLHSTPSPAH